MGIDNKEKEILEYEPDAEWLGGVKHLHRSRASLRRRHPQPEGSKSACLVRLSCIRRFWRVLSFFLYVVVVLLTVFIL